MVSPVLTSGGILLPRPSPLAMPANKAPGFDPNHIANVGLTGSSGKESLVSALVFGKQGNLVNLLNAKAGTLTGVPTALITPLGPGITAASTAKAQFTTQGTSSQITVAVIVYIAASIAAVSRMAALGISGNNAFGVDINGSNQFAWVNNSGTSTGVGITPVVGHTYFVGFTAKGTANSFYVVTDLNTGQIQMPAVSTTIVSSTWTTFTVANGPGGGSPLAGNAYVLAAMGSSNLLSQDALFAWALDPWSFWFPPSRGRDLFLSLTGPSAISTVTYTPFFDPSKKPNLSQDWLSGYGKQQTTPGHVKDLFFDPIRLLRQPQQSDQFPFASTPPRPTLDKLFDPPTVLKRSVDTPQLPFAPTPPRPTLDKLFDPPARPRQPPDSPQLPFASPPTNVVFDKLFDPPAKLRQPPDSPQLSFGTTAIVSNAAPVNDLFFEPIKLKRSVDTPQLPFGTTNIAPVTPINFDGFFDPSSRLKPPPDWAPLIIFLRPTNVAFPPFDGPQGLKTRLAAAGFTELPPFIRVVSVSFPQFDQVKPLLRAQGFTELSVPAAARVLGWLGQFDQPKSLIRNQQGPVDAPAFGAAAAVVPSSGPWDTTFVERKQRLPLSQFFFEFPGAFTTQIVVVTDHHDQPFINSSVGMMWSR